MVDIAADDHHRADLRARPPEAREQARRDGIPIFVLPDVGRRMALSEHVRSIPGLVPLAGAQVNR